jgi:hypothetical protein
MEWVPTDEFQHRQVWLCQVYYKRTAEALQALLDAEQEAPTRQFLVVIIENPSGSGWLRSKTKYGDLGARTESDAAEDADYLLNTKHKPLDWSSNLGHDDAGRMMFYVKRLITAVA